MLFVLQRNTYKYRFLKSSWCRREELRESEKKKRKWKNRKPPVSVLPELPLERYCSREYFPRVLLFSFFRLRPSVYIRVCILFSLLEKRTLSDCSVGRCRLSDTEKTTLLLVVVWPHSWLYYCENCQLKTLSCSNFECIFFYLFLIYFIHEIFISFEFDALMLLCLTGKNSFAINNDFFLMSKLYCNFVSNIRLNGL